jgi:hypothetical protein
MQSFHVQETKVSPLFLPQMTSEEMREMDEEWVNKDFRCVAKEYRLLLE